jgi:hypothetical protein
MIDRDLGGSLRQMARIGGLLYLVVIVTAFFAEMFIRNTLIVSGDAAATAQKILAAERLYRLGGLADLVNLCCDVALAMILYHLLRPGGKVIALAAAAFRLVADACLAIATFFHFAPLILLDGAPWLGAMPPAERQLLALDMIKIHSLGYNVCMLFFGVHLLLLGWLSLRSSLMPRLLGALLVVTFFCYWTNSVVHLVFPELHLSPFVLLPGLVTELALAVWLLAGGVNVARWLALAGGEVPGPERRSG